MYDVRFGLIRKGAVNFLLVLIELFSHARCYGCVDR